MKLWPVFLMSFVLGCSTPPRTYPDCEIPAPMAEVGHAVSVPEPPVETRKTFDSATYDLAGLQQWARIWKAGQGNETIAEQNALAIESRNDEINHLIECTKYMNIWIEMHESDLDDEKSAHNKDNWFYRGIIAAGVVAVVAAQ